MPLCCKVSSPNQGVGNTWITEPSFTLYRAEVLPLVCKPRNITRTCFFDKYHRTRAFPITLYCAALIKAFLFKWTLTERSFQPLETMSIPYLEALVVKMSKCNIYRCMLVDSNKLLFTYYYQTSCNQNKVYKWYGQFLSLHTC